MPRTSGDTIERLFQAATALIGEHGYAATTVDEIVEKAGVAKGTVYYHFKSKSELLEALLEDGLRRLAAGFRADIAEATTATEALSVLVHAELLYVSQYQAFAKLVMSEMWRVDRDWRDSLRTLREEYVQVIAEVIETGMSTGEFSPDLHVQTAASALFGMLASAALDWLVFSPQERLEDVYARLNLLTLNAVGARST
jgi:AcrR family transcriptional regulator